MVFGIWVGDGCGLSFSLLQKHCFDNIPIITIRSYYKEAITFTPKITLPQTIKFTIIINDVVRAKFPFDGLVIHLHQKSERGISPNQIKQTQRNSSFLLVVDLLQKSPYAVELVLRARQHVHHCYMPTCCPNGLGGYLRPSSSRCRFESTR